MMKKFALLLIGLVFALCATAQVAVTSNYKTFAGATSDTLTASATKSYVLDLGYIGKWKGQVVDYEIQVFNDYVSDSLTYTVKVYESLDGTTFKATALDSLVVTKAVADRVYYKKQTARTPRYVKVALIATSQTQKSRIYGRINVTKHE